MTDFTFGNKTYALLNFTNDFSAYYKGSFNNESSLCRCTSLYLSLDSDKAKSFYEYNKNRSNGLGIDSILVSSNVCVFRDFDCNKIIKEPFNISVFSMLLPTKDRCRLKPTYERLREIYLKRIRNLLSLMYGLGFKRIVLGAFLGYDLKTNDPKLMASCFNQILVKEKYKNLFDEIIFTIPLEFLKTTESKTQKIFKENIEFDKVLNLQGEECIENTSPIENELAKNDKNNTKTLRTFAFPIPQLKETDDYTEELPDRLVQGFSLRGVFPDDRPFLALKWKTINLSGCFAIGIDIFFSRKELSLKSTDELYGENTLPMSDTVESLNGGVNLYLSEGENIEEEEMPENIWYSLLEYLKTMKIVSFEGCTYENCAAAYMLDDNNEEICMCKVTLYENGEVVGHCPIEFPEFTIGIENEKTKDNFEFVDKD